MAEPENRLLSVVEHWLPRIEVAGIPSATAKAVIERAGSWAGWLGAWNAEGDRHTMMADEAFAAGHLMTAGEAYARASLCHHFGQFMAFDDLDAKAAAAAHKVALFERAAPLLNPPAELIEFPFESGRLRGSLRRPVSGGQNPLVLIVPGSDSTKEEFPAFENHFLARGMATFSLDGPGQGEGRVLGPLRPDIGAALQAALAVLAGKAGLSGDVALLGMAFGGHLALRAAGSIAGLTATVSINGFYDLGRLWVDFPKVYQDNMTFALGTANPRDAARGFTLRQAVDIEVPTLILHGGRDRIFPPQEAHDCGTICKAGVDIRVFPEGNHVCNNIPWHYRPLVADWLADRFVGRPASG